MAHADEELGLILEEFGAEGYGVYWLLVEDISAPMEAGKMVPTACHSVIKWSKICHCSARVLRTILHRLAEKTLIVVETIQNPHANTRQSTTEWLRITVPNVLKYKDEYSKKSGPPAAQSPDSVRTREKAERELNGDREKTPEVQLPELEVVAVDLQFSVWAESMYARHPKHKDKMLSLLALQSIFAGHLDLQKICEANHIPWCATTNWTDKDGAFAPTLHDWVQNDGWRYPPPSLSKKPNANAPLPPRRPLDEEFAR